MKRTLFVIFSIVVVCLGLAVVAPSFIDFSKYKTQAEQEFYKSTGLEINLGGDIALSILPAPRFVVSDVYIASPDGSKFDKLASFERLEVNLDLMPLFSGSVSVNSVTLVSPVIMLEMHKDGKLNTITSEFEKSSGVGAKENTNDSSASTKSFMPDISLDEIRIKDGSFSYYDHKTKSKTVVQNINADLSANSLTGPFKAQGSLFYDGNSLNFDVKTDKYDSDNKIISPNVKLTMQPSNISLEYAGVVNLANGFSVQGQTQVYSKNLASSLSAYGIKNISGLSVPLMVKGLLTANQKRLDYKSMEVALGDQNINGSVRADFAPFKFSVTAKTKQDIVINKFYSGSSPFNKASLDMKISGNDATMSIKKSEIILDGHKFIISGDYRKNNKTHKPEIGLDVKILDAVSLAQKFNIDSGSWDNKYKKASVRAKLSNIGSDMDVVANIDAIGAEVIAKGGIDKSFAIDNLTLQVKHNNMAKALHTFTGSDIASINLRKPLDIYMKISQSGKNYNLKNIKGDLSGIAVQGYIDLNLSGAKAGVSGSLNFGTLNIDSVMAQGAKGGGASRSGSSNNKNMATPTAARWSKQIIDVNALQVMDFDLALSSHKIIYGAWPLVKPSMQLKLKDGNLNISNLKAGLFGGNINFSGNVKSVPKPRQPIHFDSKFSVSNADLGKLSTALIGKQIVKISGNGDLDMNLKSSGASPAALVSDLSGSGSVKGSKIILDGVDITRFARALSEDIKPSDTISGLWGGASKGGMTYFDTLDGAFTIKNGVVTLQKMDLDGVGSMIKTRGNINLPNWTLATNHKIIIKGIDGKPSDIPDFEVAFSGSLDNPGQTFGQGLLEDYLSRKIKRKLNKLLLEKFGDKLGTPSNDNTPQQAGDGKSTQPQQAQQKTPDIEDVAEEAIKGILEGLLR